MLQKEDVTSGHIQAPLKSWGREMRLRLPTQSHLHLISIQEAPLQLKDLNPSQGYRRTSSVPSLKIATLSTQELAN